MRTKYKQMTLWDVKYAKITYEKDDPSLADDLWNQTVGYLCPKIKMKPLKFTLMPKIGVDYEI